METDGGVGHLAQSRVVQGTTIPQCDMFDMMNGAAWFGQLKVTQSTDKLAS